MAAYLVSGLFTGLLPVIASAQEGDDQRQRAPRVTSIVPAIGSENVDPSLNEIRVTFDMAMSRDGYSFVGRGAHFPRVLGPGRWIDARTWALPVKLKPNWECRFGINSPVHKNFRSIWLVPAEPTSCHFQTGGLRAVIRSPEEQRKLNIEAFDALADAIRSKYAYLELRGLDWEQLFAERRRDIVAEPTTEGWARRVATMLAAAGDVHLTVEFDGVKLPTFVRRVDPNFHRDGLARVIPTIEWKSRNIATGVTDDGIGYILIGTWAGEAAREIERAHDYLGSLTGAEGIIIDVRPNAGGSELLARKVAAWFVDEPRVYAKHVYRRGAGPDDFTPLRERTIEPNDPPRRYGGPVVILTGRRILSSGEAFLLMMKQARNATLVGEPSYGSSGNPRSAYLPNGVKVLIPSWKAMRPDGTCFEGQGIVPDVLVSGEGMDFSREDPVLAKAIALIRDRRAGGNRGSARSPVP